MLAKLGEELSRVDLPQVDRKDPVVKQVIQRLCFDFEVQLWVRAFDPLPVFYREQVLHEVAEISAQLFEDYLPWPVFRFLKEREGSTPNGWDKLRSRLRKYGWVFYLDPVTGDQHFVRGIFLIVLDEVWDEEIKQLILASMIASRHREDPLSATGMCGTLRQG